MLPEVIDVDQEPTTLNHANDDSLSQISPEHVSLINHINERGPRPIQTLTPPTTPAHDDTLSQVPQELN